MSSRICSTLAALALAACGGPAEQVTGTGNTGDRLAGTGTPGGEPALERLWCAQPGGALAQDCSIERHPGDGVQRMTIRHPDGSFRRLARSADGIVAADGASPASVRAIDPDTIEVTIEGARYRLPAR